MSVREQRRPAGGARVQGDGQPRFRRLQPWWGRATAWLREPPTPAFVALVAVAIGLRLARYAANRSLWLDEAFLAINLREKSFSELSGRLDYVQSAPLGFLYAVKSAAAMLGDSEYALRLVPLLASLTAVIAFVYVARRVLPPVAALFAVGLYATNPRLLYFSSELKPYSLDVALAIVLLALGLRAHDSQTRTFRSLLPLAIVAPVAVWFSFPSLFTLGGVAAGLGVSAFVRGDRRRLVHVAALAGTWLVSFSAVYAVASTNVSQTASALFTDSAPGGAGRVPDAIRKTWALFVDPGGFGDGTNALAALLLLVGAAAFLVDRAYVRLTLLGSPLILAAAAELLDRYPLGGRFSLFLVPSIVLLVSRGVAAAATTSRRPILVALLLAVFVAAPQLGRAASGLVGPPRSEDVRPLLADVADGWRSGDVLYVFRDAQYAVRYYSTCDDCSPVEGGFPWPTRPAPSLPDGGQFAPALESAPPAVVIGTASGDSVLESIAEMERLPAGRVWLLFSHASTGHGLDEVEVFLDALDARGERLESRTVEGAALHLYELR